MAMEDGRGSIQKGVRHLSISKSLGSYQDCRDLFEKADEDSKGCRVYISDKHDEGRGLARHFVMRLHQARDLIRKENRLLYEQGHPMHGTSIYDKFKCSMKSDCDGAWWVYVEKIELNLGAVENLSELVDYEFVEPNKQIEKMPTHNWDEMPEQSRQQTLVIEHQPTIRRRV